MSCQLVPAIPQLHLPSGLTISPPSLPELTINIPLPCCRQPLPLSLKIPIPLPPLSIPIPLVETIKQALAALDKFRRSLAIPCPRF